MTNLEICTNVNFLTIALVGRSSTAGQVNNCPKTSGAYFSSIWRLHGPQTLPRTSLGQEVELVHHMIQRGREIVLEAFSREH